MKICWKEASVRGFVALILAGACAISASAQTSLPKQETISQPSQPMRVQPSTLTGQMPDHLTGVDTGKIVRWTLKDAILAALEKNPDIEIARQNVRLAHFDILAAEGVYDPLTSSTLNYNWQRTPNISRFSGSSQNFLQNNTLSYNFGYSQLVERTGGNYLVNFNNSRLTSNTASLATSYNPALTATHAVEAAQLRYGAARSAREYAEQQLTGEQEKFSAGLSTTFLVLTRQNDLSQAR